MVISLLGSPPHTRGKVHPSDMGQAKAGITPAYAGKRLPGRQRRNPGRDHPRIRGEKLPTCFQDLIYQGSPPHTRGKATTSTPPVSRNGITPAYAGKSRRPQRWKSGGRDHPRIRGEKRLIPNWSTFRKGSPPHTRGKAHSSGQKEQRSGITPAYAGKSFDGFFRYFLHQDHPRIRGEKQRFIYIPQPYEGSPPHTRGKAASVLVQAGLAGITPAYAGKSWGGVLLREALRDHPRIRGEKIYIPIIYI